MPYNLFVQSFTNDLPQTHMMFFRPNIAWCLILSLINPSQMTYHRPIWCFSGLILLDSLIDKSFTNEQMTYHRPIWYFSGLILLDTLIDKSFTNDLPQTIMMFFWQCCIMRPFSNSPTCMNWFLDANKFHTFFKLTYRHILQCQLRNGQNIWYCYVLRPFSNSPTCPILEMLSHLKMTQKMNQSWTGA